MESAQQPPGIDQFAVPEQRTPPDEGVAALGRLGAPGQTGGEIGEHVASGPAPAASVAPAPVKRRRHPALVVLGGMLALLLLGGVGIAFVVYDDATAPNRSAPDIVVDNYLRAFLVEHDDTRAALYTCEGTATLARLEALRQDLEAREKKFSIRVRVTWGSLKVESAPSGKRVTTDVFLTVGDGSEQANERWQFDVIEQDGWRVCGANRAG